MQQVGRYELTHRLGAGGMGEVWAGRDLDHGWPVAAKCVRVGGEGWADPLAEVRAVAAMDHPNIVRVLDAIRDGDVLWIVMERAVRSLADAPPADWSGVRVVIESVLRALAHAHARGIVHLDVKAENVLDARPGPAIRWVLADFGLAHLTGVVRPGDARARGTPIYMAPEQFTGDTALWGPPTDLYAVGCLLTVLVEGSPPFRQTEFAALSRAHRFQDPGPCTPRFNVPEGLDAFRLRLLEKAPGDRFPLAADALAALEALSASGSPPAEPPPPWRAETFVFGPDGADAPADLPSDRDRASWTPPAPIDEGPDAPPDRMVASAGLLDVRTLPLVGRGPELARLLAALDRVTATSRPAWVAVTGRPGIGRSALSRAFAWGANERGRALLARGHLDAVLATADRPVIAQLDGHDGAALADALTRAAPLLVVVRGEPDHPDLPPPIDRIALEPLAPWLGARLARNLAPLDETLVAELARTCGGHPGQIVARIRGWTERLRPGPFGLVLAPAEGPDPGAWLDGVAPDDPLLPLAWSVEEDPDRALDDLLAAVMSASQQGTPGRAHWLLALVQRALARATRPTGHLAYQAAALRAGALNAMGHLDQAVDAARHATRLARALGEPELLATALSAEAHLVRHVGEDPLPLLAEAEALSVAPLTAARARATRGSILIQRGEYAQARVLLESAIAELRRHDEPRFQGTALLWLGNAWSYERVHPTARQKHRESLEAFERIGNASGIAMAALALAEDELRLNDHDAAREAIDRAEAAAARSESPWMSARAQSLRGWWLERAGRLDEAELALRDARNVSRDTDTADHDTAIRLARVLIRQGRSAEAATVLAELGPSSGDSESHFDLALLRVASLAPSDPAWSVALDAVRSLGTLPSEALDVLVLARDRLAGESSGELDALIASGGRPSVDGPPDRV